MSSIAEIKDHVAAAKGRLLQQSKGKPRMSGLVAGLANVVQQFESQVAYPVLRGRDYSQAVGNQLDRIGDLVGQLRSGQDDATYRLFLAGRIFSNNSNATTETILALVRQVFGAKSAQIIGPFSAGFAVSEAPAVVGIEVGSPSITASLYPAAISVCKDSLAAVVRISWVSVYDVAHSFALDGPVSGAGLDGQATTLGMAQLIYSDAGA